MTQKIIRVGTSAAVTIPKQTMAALGWHVGDRVRLAYGRGKGARIIPIPSSPVPDDRETIAWTKKFIERYKPALDALSKK